MLYFLLRAFLSWSMSSMLEHGVYVHTAATPSK